MPSSHIFSLDPSEYSKIDPRLKSYLEGWQLKTIYKGQQVDIPDTWDSSVFATKYFEVIKQPGEPNYKPGGEEDEIALTLEFGWPGYDSECMAIVSITGPDVKLQNAKPKIHAEILKMGEADMKLYHNGHFLTDFTQEVHIPVGPQWWTSYQRTTIEKSKVWIEDLG